MKTNRKNTKSGLPIRSEQSSTPETITQTASAPVQAPAPVSPAPASKPDQAPLAVVDFQKRRERRELPTDRVLELLRTEAPQFFGFAEVVGKWVWVQFADKQPREVTGALSQLGFHWNTKRQAWQHPCGAFTTGSTADPRTKYGTHFAADQVPA